MITKKQNTQHIIMALIFFIALALIAILASSCRPSFETCSRLYPAQYKDTTKIKKDSVNIPYLVFIPGDTIRLTGKVDRPCPDSIKQWALFTDQINFILSQNKKYRQTIDFDRNILTLQLDVAKDSMLLYKKLYTIEISKEKSVLTPVPYPKTPTWVWWLIGILALITGASFTAYMIKLSK